MLPPMSCGKWRRQRRVARGRRACDIRLEHRVRVPIATRRHAHIGNPWFGAADRVVLPMPCAAPSKRAVANPVSSSRKQLRRTLDDDAETRPEDGSIARGRASPTLMCQGQTKIVHFLALPLVFERRSSLIFACSRLAQRGAAPRSEASGDRRCPATRWRTGNHPCRADRRRS